MVTKCFLVVLQVEMKLEVMTTSSMVPFLISGKKEAIFNFFCMMLPKPQCSLWVLNHQARLGLERHIDVVWASHLQRRAL